MNISKKKKKQEETVEFFKDFFLPQNEEEAIEVSAHSLAGAFLVKVEEILEEKKISKKELAKKIGTSSSYLSQIFYSKVLLNFKTLAKIEKVLNIKFDVTMKSQTVNNYILSVDNDYDNLLKFRNSNNVMTNSHNLERLKIEKQKAIDFEYESQKSIGKECLIA